MMQLSHKMEFKELYELTISPNISAMRELAGHTVELEGWALSEREIGNNILYIRTNLGCYATNSKTLVTSFSNIIDMRKACEQPLLFKLEIVSKKSSNSSRYYSDCIYAGEIE